MPPFVALLLWVVLLFVLLFLDPAKEPKTSFALWVPVIWMFITGSRLPAQWLGAEGTMVQAQAFQEGNPIDRTFFLVLILLSIVILVSRSFNWGQFFARNKALSAFVAFALLSLLWSDFPLVAFKRWYRDLGSYLVILVALSDLHPGEAVRTVLRRFCYLSIPLSIVLIKYFPELGRRYSEWTGAAYFVGVTTSKNMLGAVAMVGGLFFFWDTVTRWATRKEGRTKRILMVNFAFIAMAVWLINVAESATSRVCLVIGCLVIVVVRSEWAKRHPGFIKALIPVTFGLYLILAFGFNINADLASEVGRDPTLTGRADIWKLLLSMHTNPLIGTGYESFWVGPRLKPIWQQFGQINESHNGYLEIYLNLGLIGVFILVALLIGSYQNICKSLSSRSELASLSLALWTMVLFYNMTEAAFRLHLMWVLFLLVAIAVPERPQGRASAVAALSNPGATERLARFSFENAGSRR